VLGYRHAKILAARETVPLPQPPLPPLPPLPPPLPLPREQRRLHEDRIAQALALQRFSA